MCENSIGSFEKCIFLINYFKNPSWNHDKHSTIVSVEVKLSPDVNLLFRLGVSHQHTPEKWQLLLLQVVESLGRWDLLSLGPFGGCGSSTFWALICNSGQNLQKGFSARSLYLHTQIRCIRIWMPPTWFPHHIITLWQHWSILNDNP